MSSFFQKTKDSVSDGLNLLPGNQPQYCPSLSWKQRLYGCGICVALGFICGILSTVMIFLLSFVAFGVLYTFANIFSIGSSMFLMGPLRQLKSMCQPVRLLCTIAYFVFMGLTLFAAFYLNSGILVLLFVFLQFCALVWYTLSYIPYAQQCLCSCFKTTTGLDEA